MTAVEVKERQRLTNNKKEYKTNESKEEQKKKDLKQQLKAYQLARKKNKDGALMRLEKISNTHRMDRGKAFGGKYDGTVARHVMRNAKTICKDFRAELQKMDSNLLKKDTDECLDKLTKDMIELLEAWDKFFTLLHKEKPTQEDKNKAPVLADKAAKKGREMLGNATLKGHIAEIHVPKYFRDMPNGLFRLLIEHWVERNHQDRKNEAQHKYIPNAGKKMNSITQREHTIKHPEIQD